MPDKPRLILHDTQPGTQLPAVRLDHDDALDARRLARGLRTRVWTIAWFFVAMVLGALGITALQPKIYRASASLQIDVPASTVAPFEGAGLQGGGQLNYWANQEYYKTQHARLTSRSQARAVVTSLTALPPSLAEAADPVGAILEMVDIEPREKTRLVWIHVEHSDLAFAEQLAGQWASVFVSQNQAERLDDLTVGLGWLQQQVSDAKRQIEEAEAKIVSFKKTHEVLSLSDASDGVLANELGELGQAYARAQADRAIRQAEMDALRETLSNHHDPMKLSLMVDSSLMGQLREDLSRQHSERQVLLGRYGEKHPKVLEVNRRIETLNQQILAETRGELDRRASLHDLASKTETELGAALRGRTGDVVAETEQGAEYSLLLREREARAAIYDVLLERLQELDVTRSLTANNIRVVDGAEGFLDPVSPNVKLNLALAVLIGLVGGVSLAWFLEWLDSSVKSREDVEALGLGFLGILPKTPGPGGSDWDEARQRYLFSLNHPRSPFAEFCRALRTNVSFSRRADGEPMKRIVVTSASPEEGKTTVSINLAISLAQAGKKVLLIDADLRRPSLHHAFDLRNDDGLSTWLSGAADLDSCTFQTGLPGLTVLPAGPRPPSPAELLGAPMVEEYLRTLDRRFDVILVDSPPVVAVTDAVVLAQRVDGVILVLKSFKVPRDLVAQARRQLSDVEATFIGAVLNDHDLQKAGEGYGTYYYNYYEGDRDRGVVPEEPS